MGEPITSSAELSHDNSVQEVSKLVTRVWEHPLMTEQTRTHREEGRALFTRFMGENSLDLNEFIGIPVGSTVWCVDHGASDHDIIVISNASDQSNARLQTALASLKSELRALLFDQDHPYANLSVLDSLYLASDINIHDLSKYPIPSPLLSLLLTPNEYLIGNLELANSLRSRLVDNSNFTRIYDALLMQLIHEYKNWTAQDNSGEIMDDKRSNRYERHLNARGKQSRMGVEAYTEAFEAARFRLGLPNQETFQRGVKQTGGAININPRYVAHGIKPGSNEY